MNESFYAMSTMTVLRRQGGTWTAAEVKALRRSDAHVCQNRHHPEYLILLGSPEKSAILSVLPAGALDFEISKVQGIYAEPPSTIIPHKPQQLSKKLNEGLPYKPSF